MESGSSPLPGLGQRPADRLCGGQCEAGCAAVTLPCVTRSQTDGVQDKHPKSSVPSREFGIPRVALEADCGRGRLRGPRDNGSAFVLSVPRGGRLGKKGERVWKPWVYLVEGGRMPPCGVTAVRTGSWPRQGS